MLSDPGDVLPVLRVAYCASSREILCVSGIDLGGQTGAQESTMSSSEVLRSSVARRSAFALSI
jgi:hypothetical protein